MKAMILAAGYGTRFRPVTHVTPKPMIEVCNRPLIAYAIDELLRFGVREIVINLHHLPEQIEEFVAREYGTRCAFSFSLEKEILGTGGGVRRVRKHLENDPFILVNGDTIQAPPFEAIASALEKENAIAALALRHPPANDRFTPVFLDSGRITGIGSGTGEALMFSGAHAISPEIFRFIPQREFSGIVEDVYNPLLASNDRTLAGVVDDGYWFDIGTPARYLGASLEIARLMRDGTIAITAGSHTSGDSLIDDSARVEAEMTTSVIGKESTLAPTARVSRSIVWKRATIAAGCTISDSIVCDDVVVPGAWIVENALLWTGERADELPDSAVRINERSIATPIDPSRDMIVRRGS